jgi:hypothetical protein
MKVLCLRTAATARNEVEKIARSELCLLQYLLKETFWLTSFVTGSSRKSNDSAQAHALLVRHRSSSQKTTVQRRLPPSRNPVAPQHEASVTRSTVRRSERRNAPKLQTGARVVPNGEKQTVCQVCKPLNEADMEKNKTLSSLHQHPHLSTNPPYLLWRPKPPCQKL